MSKNSAKKCRNEQETPHASALVGVYCAECMSRFKGEAARRRLHEQAWRAVEAGAGDLWRLG